MSSSLHFIELSSYVEPPLGYPSGPYFETDLWPLLLQHAHQIEKVFLFKQPSSSIDSELFSAGNIVSPDISDIGCMERLSKNQLKALSGLSFFGGHLSVLYQISAQSFLFPQLLKLYSLPPKLSDDSINNLGVENDVRLKLAGFVETVRDNKAIVSFAHDADPLYIFGSPKTLRSVLAFVLSIKV